MPYRIKSPERKYKRKKIIAVIDLYTSTSDLPVGQGCLVNLSIGGASIESNIIFQKYQRVILNIPLSTDNRYSISGEVLRIENMPLHTYRYGIQFGELSIRERLELFRVVVPLLLKRKKSGRAQEE